MACVKDDASVDDGKATPCSGFEFREYKIGHLKEEKDSLVGLLEVQKAEVDL